MATEKFQSPLQKFLPEIGQAVLNHDMIYVQADTGTGKSTGVPAILSKLFRGQKIYVSESSNLAVATIANFVSKGGYKVGYINDFHKQTDWSIDILYTHHKYLCSKLSHEIGHKYFSMGEKYKWPMGVIVLDDVQLLNQYGIAVLKMLDYVYQCWKQNPKKLSKPPKLVMMGSDVTKISTVLTLPENQIFCYKCRLNQIDIVYGFNPGENDVNPDDDKIYYRAVSKAVEYHRSNYPGHYLLFAPGRYEADFMYSELLSELSRESTNKVSVYLVRDEINCGTIFDIISKTQKNLRCIIICTSICEQSITFPGITLVIDTLTERYMPSALDMLENKFIRHISRNRSIERMGRTGRTCAGTYVPMMTQSQYELLEDYLTEIHDYSQSIIMLQANGLNINSIYDFPDTNDYVKFLSKNKIYDSGGNVDKSLLEIINYIDLPIRFQLIIWRFINSKVYSYTNYHLLIITILMFYGNGIIILPKKKHTEDINTYRNRIDTIKYNIRKNFCGYSDLDTIINICVDMMSSDSNVETTLKLKKYCQVNYLSFRRISQAISAFNTFRLNKIFRNKLFNTKDIVNEEISSEFFGLLELVYSDIRVNTSISIIGNVVGSIQNKYYRFEKYAFNNLDLETSGHKTIYPLLTQQKKYGKRDVNIISVVHANSQTDISDTISIFGSDMGETISSIHESDIEERLAMLLSDDIDIDYSSDSTESIDSSEYTDKN